MWEIWPKWKGKPKGGNICIHKTDSLCYTGETKQHCKATMLQERKKFFKKEKKDPRNHASLQNMYFPLPFIYVTQKRH